MGLRPKEKIGVRIDIERFFGKPVKPSVHGSPGDPSRSEKFRKIIEWVFCLSRRKLGTKRLEEGAGVKNQDSGNRDLSLETEIRNNSLTGNHAASGTTGNGLF
jgi:hypothetical protein